MPGFLSVRPQDWATIEPAAGASAAFIGTSSGVFAYSASGDSWSDITPDAGDNTIVGIAAIDGHLWAVSDTPTLWHSTDSGASWSTVSLPGSSGTCDSLHISGSVLILVRNDCSSSSDNGLYAGAADGSGSFTKIVSGSTSFTWMGDIVGTALWYAINSGAIRHFHTRTPVSSGGSDTDIAATGAAGTTVAIRGEPSDATIAYACVGFDFTPGPARLYRIVGTTPTDISPLTVTSSSNGVLDAASNGSGVLLALTQSGGGIALYRSDDDGATWDDVQDSGSVVSGWPKIGWSATADLVYVVNDAGLATSEDAGLTWTTTADADDTPACLAVL